MYTNTGGIRMQRIACNTLHMLTVINFVCAKIKPVTLCTRKGVFSPVDIHNSNPLDNVTPVRVQLYTFPTKIHNVHYVTHK